jgi:predicted dehydrogenase
MPRSSIALAESRKRVLMVGHLLEYHPVVTRLREMIAREELGRLYYIYSQRVNLGTVRADENALWNFAPHDISVIMFLLGAAPTDVAARGQSYLQKGVEDVVFLTMNFGGPGDGPRARELARPAQDPQAHAGRRPQDGGVRRPRGRTRSCASTTRAPGATRTTTRSPSTSGLRFGDITLPYIKVGEPLQIECRHFIECVRSRKAPVSDGHDGLRVVRCSMPRSARSRRMANR